MLFSFIFAVKHILVIANLELISDIHCLRFLIEPAHELAIVYIMYMYIQSGPEGIKRFSCSTQLSMEF